LESTDTPLYTSSPTGKSLKNAYFVHADRIELCCRFPFFTKTMIIKKEDLISIEVFEPPVIKTTFWALKLDLADLNEHVGIKRKNGFFKQLRFTPENPKEFISKVNEILK